MRMIHRVVIREKPASKRPRIRSSICSLNVILINELLWDRSEMYWTEVLTNHPKITIFFVVQYFGKHNLPSIARISWNLIFCLQFAHANTHKTIKIHV